MSLSRNRPKSPVKAAPLQLFTQCESRLQQIVVQWWALACKGYRVPEFLLWATPNGGKRGMLEAVRMKREGVRPGVPDLFLAVPSGGAAGLFIEMKTGTGRESAEQKVFAESLREQGYKCYTCHSAEGAIETIQDYLT